MSEKTFVMILGPIWSKIVFWKKKKLPNLSKNTENFRFFKSPKMAGSGRNWIKCRFFRRVWRSLIRVEISVQKIYPSRWSGSFFISLVCFFSISFSDPSLTIFINLMIAYLFLCLIFVDFFFFFQNKHRNGM